MSGYDDFSIWYSPVSQHPAKKLLKTRKLFMSIPTREILLRLFPDGTRVLGPGDIGAEASMPVMEGKALLLNILAVLTLSPFAWTLKILIN